MSDTATRPDAEQLARDYLPLAHKIARGYVRRLPHGVDGEDLYGAARLGLMQAARRYDEAYGAFATYASSRITGAVVDEMRRMDRLPRRERHLLGRLTRDEAMTDNERARALEARRRSKLFSLDQMREDTGYDRPATDPGVDAAIIDTEERAELFALVSLLAGRQWDVVMAYHFRGEPQHLIAMRLGVSDSRVSQILADAYRVLRAAAGAA